MIDGKCFVDYKPAGFDGQFNLSNKWAVKVAKNHNASNFFTARYSGVGQLEIHRPKSCKMLPVSIAGGRLLVLDFSQCFEILVGKNHRDIVFDEKQAVAARATGKIQNRTSLGRLSDPVKVVAQ